MSCWLQKFLDENFEIELRVIDYSTDTDNIESFKFIYDANNVIISLVYKESLSYSIFECNNSCYKFIRKVNSSDIYNVPVVYEELIIFYNSKWILSADIYNKFNELDGWQSRGMIRS